MNEKEETKISLDILRHLKNLSNKINRTIEPHAENVFRKYPITFGLLILIGVMTLHEGLKGLMKNLGLLDVDPLYLTVVGIGLLIITGTIYKKLDK